MRFGVVILMLKWRMDKNETDVRLHSSRVVQPCSAKCTLRLMYVLVFPILVKLKVVFNLSNIISFFVIFGVIRMYELKLIFNLSRTSILIAFKEAKSERLSILVFHNNITARLLN